jgi:hypothetical protein
MTDKEIKRFDRFMKTAENSCSLDITVIGRKGTEVFEYRFIKSNSTSYKLKVQCGRDYHNPTTALETVFAYSRYVTSIRGYADYPLSMLKEIGGKTYRYDQKTFTKYF